MYERTRERDAARLLVEARSVELDQALDKRLRFIQKNRRRMLADARKDVDREQAQLNELVSRLPALRQRLLDARDTLLWAASFPDPVEAWGHPTAVALGLQEPVRRVTHSNARVEFESLVRLLDVDAEVLASRFSADPAQDGRGRRRAARPD